MTATGLVIRGRRVVVPGLPVVNYLDDQSLALVLDGNQADGKLRDDRAWLRQIVLHTTKGRWPQAVRPGARDADAEHRCANLWRRDPQNSGTHLVVDGDGSVGQLADLQRVRAFHASSRAVNASSIGIELWQDADGSVYQATLDAAVLLVDALTALFGIQRQFPTSSGGHYLGHPLKRMEQGGQDCVGVFGHRDVTEARGQGDPGDAIFDALSAAGYEGKRFHLSEDIVHWRLRQRKLNSDRGAELTVDGVPGPATRRALVEAGYPLGQWVSRPIDALLGGA